jgi:P22 coat protein - gene protein 5
MPENVLNNTTNAVFIPTIVAQKALGRLSSYLNLAKTVSRDTSWVTSSFGQTIQVPKRGAVSANDKVAGSNYTKQNPTATNVSVVLNKHKEVTVTITDITKVLENQDTLNGYGEDAAIAIAEAIETDIAKLHTGLTNTITMDFTSATTTDNSMLNIRKWFTDQKVPLVEKKHLYVDPTMFNKLLTVDKYTRVDARGDGSAISTGRMLNVYGMDIWESQLIEKTGSPAAFHNFAYTSSGIVLATRALPKPMGFGGDYAVINDGSTGVSVRTLFWYNADLGAHQLTLDVLYGTSILDDRRVLEVESF